jgi:type IV pilus assembly protein PilN
MRININLATERYEAVRQYLQRIRTLVALLTLIAVALVGYIFYQRSHTRDIDAKITQAKQELTELNNEKAQAQAILNKPANRGIADQSEFLNELFARKSLSWTRIFSEMERIMPPNIHVVSIKPDYTPNNELVVHMVVATDSRDRAVELVKRMEKSSHFHLPQIVAENVTSNTSDQGAGPGNIQFDIASVYVPQSGSADLDEEKPEDQKSSAPQKSADKHPSVPPGATQPAASTTAQNQQRQH